MVSFSLKNEILSRLQSFCECINSDSNIEIVFGEEFISIPSEVAASISTYFYDTIIKERTIKRIDLNDVVKTKFRNESNTSTILKLLQNNSFEVENLSNEDILDYFEFGCNIGCSLFMRPLLEQYAKQSANGYNFENEPIENILSIITNKTILLQYTEENKSISNINIDNEINFVSRQLFKLFNNDVFIKWCLEAENFDTLENIIRNENVIVSSEDSLLDFILFLSQQNETYYHLLEYVFFEYCSIESISQFITTCKHIISSPEYQGKESLLFFECLSRRCLKLCNGTKLEQLQRHTKTKITETRNDITETISKPTNNITEVPYDANNPKKGILNHEYLKHNIELEASSIKYPNYSDMQLSDLFVRMDNYSFCTKNEANSSITATIKDNKSFTVNKYMIRGKWGNGWHLKSWKIKGKLSSTKEWIELDSHSNEKPFDTYEVRTFNINETEPLCGIQIIQTGPNEINDNYFSISGFDVFGKIIEYN